MGMPNITIAFQTAASTAIARSQKGVCALIVRDSAEALAGTVLTYTNATQISTELTAANQAYIARTFVGNDGNPPKKVYVYVDAAEDELATALAALATWQFDYLAGPPDITPAEAAAVKTWILFQRANNYAICKAVLPNLAADSEAIINFTTDGLTDGVSTWTAAEYCSRIAGILAGTPLSSSATYAVLSELTDCDRLTAAEQDTAVDSGQLIAFYDGAKVKLGRAVNSLTTTTSSKGAAWQKIKIVEAIDMQQHDIRQTIADTYIGKFANTYDNKCVLISAISRYLAGMQADGVLNSGYTVGIDLNAQRTYLEEQGTDTSEMTDDEIKQANTGSHVFLSVVESILDAIEDVAVEVSM